jgi:hypothetical protein
MLGRVASMKRPHGMNRQSKRAGPNDMKIKKTSLEIFSGEVLGMVK